MTARFVDAAGLVSLTGDPAGARAAGDVWWRGDRGQLHASDGLPGAVTVGPTGTLPVVRAGAWHMVPASGESVSITPALNRVYALPLWPGRSCTLTGVSAFVSLLGLGNLRMGLYTDDAGLPGVRVADFGTVATGIAGAKTITTSQPLRPILYWLAIVQQGLLNVGLLSRATADPMVSQDVPFGPNNPNAYYAGGVSGALPATFPDIDGVEQGPAMSVRLE